MGRKVSKMNLFLKDDNASNVCCSMTQTTVGRIAINYLTIKNIEATVM